MQTDLGELKRLVFDVARTSPLGSRIKNVTLEADSDNYGSEFLRVILGAHPLAGITYDSAMILIGAIEKAVLDVDDRHPSVRFADAT